MAGNEEPDELRRLRWQCRRGLLELDLLLSRFLANDYPNLNAQGQQCFRDLLEQPDALLWSWLQGQDPAPDNFKQVIMKVMQ